MLFSELGLGLGKKKQRNRTQIEREKRGEICVNVGICSSVCISAVEAKMEGVGENAYVTENILHALMTRVSIG